MAAMSFASPTTNELEKQPETSTKYYSLWNSIGLRSINKINQFDRNHHRSRVCVCVHAYHDIYSFRNKKKKKKQNGRDMGRQAGKLFCCLIGSLLWKVYFWNFYVSSFAMDATIPYNTRTHAHSHRQTQTQTFAHTRPIFYLSIAKSKRFQIATLQKNDFSSLKFAVFVSLVSSSNVSFLFSVHFGQREVEKK